MRRLWLLFAALLPPFLKPTVYRRFFGWKIGRGVVIGLSYIDAREVTFGDGVHIGHFNIVRAVRRLSVGSRTRIANFNQFFGALEERFVAELQIGDDVYFMSRHFVDVVGSVSIGQGTTIGGRDTQFWSHTLTLVNGQQSLVPTRVQIGANVYVGARATLVSCNIPDDAIVGAGSVVTKQFAPEAVRLLIAGNPATIVKRYAGD